MGSCWALSINCRGIALPLLQNKGLVSAGEALPAKRVEGVALGIYIVAAAVVELPLPAYVALDCVLMMDVDEGVVAGLEDAIDVLKVRAEGAGVGVALISKGLLLA